MGKKTKICQVACNTYGGDPRIVWRTTKTLAEHYHTSLIINSPPSIDGVRTIHIPRYKSLLKRTLLVHPLVLFHCLRINAKVYHFHNPELILLFLLLKLLGKIIVFDVHENILAQLNLKKKQKGGSRKRIVQYFNNLAEKHFNLILAEDSYLPLYPNAKNAIEVIHNFPDHIKLQDDFEDSPSDNKNDLFYIGGLSKFRGLYEMIECISKLKKEGFESRLILVGPLHEKEADVLAYSENLGVSERIIFHGSLPQLEGFIYATSAIAGLAVLSAEENYVESYPCKIFEYMALGIPVICSNFPLYKSIVQKHDCGICVEPDNPNELFDAAKQIIQNPQLASKMGKRGKLAVKNHFNWHLESKKLLDFYNLLLKGKLVSHD